MLLALAGGTARRQLLLQTAAILAGGLWLYRQLAEADLAPEPGSGLLQLAGTGAAVLGLSSMAFRAGAPEGRRLHRCAVALACAGWAAWAVLPSQIMTAGSGELVLRTGTSTVSARLLMYRDALWQIGTNPWWGGGGGVWRSVYRSIQTEPYVGAQVHSGYLDMLLNLGIPGLLVLVLWFTIVGFLLLKRRSLLLAPYLVLVLHAGVDFDMSYGLIWLLLLWLGVLGLAEMGAVQGRPWKTAGKERTIRLTNFSKLRKAVVSNQGYNKSLRHFSWFRRNNQSGSGSQADLERFFPSLPPTRLALALGTYMSSQPCPALRSIWNTWIKRVFGGSVPAAKAARRGGGSSRDIHGLFRGITALTIAGVLAFMSLVSLRMLAGDRLAAEAAVLLSRGKAQQARVLFEKALDLNPYRTGPRIALAAELPPLSAEHILRRGIRFSPQMSELWWELAKAQFKLGRPEAAKAAELAVRLDRYHSRRITAALHELGRLGLRLSQAGRMKESRTAVLTGLRLYDGFRKAAEWAAGKGIRNDRKFTVTDEARREAERLWGLLGFPFPPYVAFSGRS
ncbi:O-antigen ligase family protein [Paenibacillus tuaregi]|nr:O-antigen ligase family protein [Paenibacillus tuaregi]